MIMLNRPTGSVLSPGQVYSLRQALVRRLQTASRGVTRQVRARHHRAFIQEWERFRRDERLGLLQRALAFGPAVVSEAGDLWRRSFLLDLAVSASLPFDQTAPETEGLRDPIALPELPQVPAAPEVPGNRVGRGVDSGAPNRVPPVLQADLFSGELATNPA